MIAGVGTENKDYDTLYL